MHLAASLALLLSLIIVLTLSQDCGYKGCYLTFETPGQYSNIVAPPSIHLIGFYYPSSKLMSTTEVQNCIQANSVAFDPFNHIFYVSCRPNTQSNQTRIVALNVDGSFIKELPSFQPLCTGEQDLCVTFWQVFDFRTATLYAVVLSAEPGRKVPTVLSLSGKMTQWTLFAKLPDGCAYGTSFHNYGIIDTVNSHIIGICPSNIFFDLDMTTGETTLWNKLVWDVQDSPFYFIPSLSNGTSPPSTSFSFVSDPFSSYTGKLVYTLTFDHVPKPCNSIINPLYWASITAPPQQAYPFWNFIARENSCSFGDYCTDWWLMISISHNSTGSQLTFLPQLNTSPCSAPLQGDSLDYRFDIIGNWEVDCSLFQ